MYAYRVQHCVFLLCRVVRRRHNLVVARFASQASHSCIIVMMILGRVGREWSPGVSCCGFSRSSVYLSRREVAACDEAAVLGISARRDRCVSCRVGVVLCVSCVWCVWCGHSHLCTDHRQRRRPAGSIAAAFPASDNPERANQCRTSHSRRMIADDRLAPVLTPPGEMAVVEFQRLICHCVGTADSPDAAAPQSWRTEQSSTDSE